MPIDSVPSFEVFDSEFESEAFPVAVVVEKLHEAPEFGEFDAPVTVVGYEVLFADGFERLFRGVTFMDRVLPRP